MHVQCELTLVQCILALRLGYVGFVCISGNFSFRSGDVPCIAGFNADIDFLHVPPQVHAKRRRIA